MISASNRFLVRPLAHKSAPNFFGGSRPASLHLARPIPSERDLAEQFRVARTSVREAIQGLLSLGVIERRGNRSFVVEHLPR